MFNKQVVIDENGVRHAVSFPDFSKMTDLMLDRAIETYKGCKQITALNAAENEKYRRFIRRTSEFRPEVSSAMYPSFLMDEEGTSGIGWPD